MRFDIRSLSIIAVLAVLFMAPASAATTRPVLLVTDYKVAPVASIAATTPGPLMPGDTGTVVVSIANTLKGTSGTTSQTTETYNYYGSNAGPDITTVKTTQGSDAPQGYSVLKSVSLLESGPVKVLSQPYTDPGCLGLGDSARFEFTIKADEGAADGKYYLPFRVKTDDDNVFINQVVPVVIDSSGVRLILNDAPASLGNGKNSLVLDVVNYRPNGVTSVSVIPSGDEFVFKPRQEYTVGNVGSGEMYTVTFDIVSKNGVYNNSPSFVVKYKNGDHRHQSTPLTVHLDAMDGSQAQAADDSGLLYLVGGIALVAVAAAGIFLFMRGQRAKK